VKQKKHQKSDVKQKINRKTFPHKYSFLLIFYLIFFCLITCAESSVHKMWPKINSYTRRQKIRLIPQRKNSNNRRDQVNFLSNCVPFILVHTYYIKSNLLHFQIPIAFVHLCPNSIRSVPNATHPIESIPKEHNLTTIVRQTFRTHSIEEPDVWQLRTLQLHS
jgi:hypothetical protein